MKKNLLLILLFLVLLVQKTQAAYAYVAGGDNADPGGGTSLTLTSVTFASHETVMITVTYGSATRIVESFSDGTNAYTYVGTVSDAGNGQSLAYFVLKDATAGTYTLTFGLATPASYTGLAYRRYTGLNNTGTPQFISNVQNNVSTSSNAITSTTIAPSAQPCILFASTLESTGSGSTPSAGTGFTSRGAFSVWDVNISKTMSEDIRLTSTSAVAATFTASNSSNTYITGAIVFPETGVGGGAYWGVFGNNDIFPLKAGL